MRLPRRYSCARFAISVTGVLCIFQRSKPNMVADSQRIQLARCLSRGPCRPHVQTPGDVGSDRRLGDVS